MISGKFGSVLPAQPKINTIIFALRKFIAFWLLESIHIRDLVSRQRRILILWSQYLLEILGRVWEDNWCGTEPCLVTINRSEQHDNNNTRS
jgi:hypothetical protein